MDDRVPRTDFSDSTADGPLGHGAARRLFHTGRPAPTAGHPVGRSGPSGTHPEDRNPDMTENEFQAKLGDLLSQIGSLPDEERPKLEALAAETRQRHERMKKTIADLQESLDYLRLSVKYLVFDLEATRRENKYLRSLIESQHGGKADTEDAEE